MGRFDRWRPAVAALSVILSALIGVATNVVTQSGTIALSVTVGGLVALAAGLAWWEGHREAAHARAEAVTGETSRMPGSRGTVRSATAAPPAPVRAVAIERHTMLANGRTTALLTPDARVTWLCHPLPHSAALFAELIGGEEAGHFSVAPIPGGPALQQRYRGATMTAETRWPTLTVLDWLDHHGRHSALLRDLHGHGKVQVTFAPRPEFGRLPVRLAAVDGGLQVKGSNEPVALRSPGIDWTVERNDAHESAYAVVDLADQGGRLTLELRLGTDDLSPSALDTTTRRRRAQGEWSDWAASLDLPPVAEFAVRRSALIMRALCYQPTGAILASSTTSLPQVRGGSRNWDYRYCWLRDAAMSARALVDLGSYAEAEEFLQWVSDLGLNEEGRLDPLRAIYTVDRAEIPTEAVVEHLPGYAGSAPVRIGNSAYRHIQLDVFGSLADLIGGIADRRAPTRTEIRLLASLADAVARHWADPDHGIWEARRPPRHHVYSKVMCWLGLHQAVRVHATFGLPIEPRWAEARDLIAVEVVERGWNRTVGAYTSAYGVAAIDAAALWIGLSGLLPVDDPRFAATVSAVESRLRVGPAVRPVEDDDTAPGDLSGFHLCTSWLIDAYVRLGRIGAAQDLFAAMLRCLGPTGLLAEGYDPVTAQAAGNIPEAFSHAGLVQAARVLGRAEGTGPTAHRPGADLTR